MKKLITFALAALFAGNAFSADIKVSDVPKLRTASDSLAFLGTYLTGGVYKTRLMTLKDIIRLVTQTDSGLTNSYASGLGLRPAVGGIKNWHIADNALGIGKLSTVTRDSIRKRQPHEEAVYNSMSTDQASMNFDTGTLTIPAGRVFIGDGSYITSSVFTGSIDAAAVTSIIFKPTSGTFTIAQHVNTDDTLGLSNRNVIMGVVYRGGSNNFWFRGRHQYVFGNVTYKLAPDQKTAVDSLRTFRVAVDADKDNLIDAGKFEKNAVEVAHLATAVMDSTRKRQPHEGVTWLCLNDSTVTMNFDTGVLTIPKGRSWDGAGNYISTNAASLTPETAVLQCIILKGATRTFAIAAHVNADDTLALSNRNVIVGAVFPVFKDFTWAGQYNTVISGITYKCPAPSGGISQQYLSPIYPGGVLQGYSGADSLYISVGWDAVNAKNYMSAYSTDSSNDFQYNSEIIRLTAYKGNADLPTNFINIEYRTQDNDTSNCYLQVQIMNYLGGVLYTSPKKLFSATDGKWTTETITKSSGTISTIQKNQDFYIKLNFYSKRVSGTGQYVQTGKIGVFWEPTT